MYGPARLLREDFNEDTLKVKYSAEFNNWRETLLQQINPANQRLKMDHIDELVRENGQNTNVQIYLDELKKTKSLNFNRGVNRSEMACNLRLIRKVFKFLCKFSAPQLITKYEHLLGITEHLVKRSGICDWEKSLIEAMDSSNIEISRLMIDGGADVNGRGRNHGTSLILASEKGHFDIVKCLVANGAEVNAKYCNDQTALTYASEKGHLETVKCLIENGADVNGRGWNKPLILASKNGHFEIVKYLRENGADVDAKYDFDMTAIIVAFGHGELATANYLLDIGAVFDSTDRNQALVLASGQEEDNLEMVVYLVEEGADVNVPKKVQIKNRSLVQK